MGALDWINPQRLLYENLGFIAQCLKLAGCRRMADALIRQKTSLSSHRQGLRAVFLERLPASCSLYVQTAPVAI